MSDTLRLRGRRLVVASHNAGKVREIAALLAPLDVEAISAATLGLPEPEEPEPTFLGNARIKAHAAARASGLPALADDSGLEVRGLAGAPGVLSARWAGPEKDFTAAMRRIETELHARGAQDRAARFVCALALAEPDGREVAVEGEVQGRLVWPPRGERGFGYDPMFTPDGGALTFGEMEPAAKHAISHRADAFRRLLAALA